LRVAVVHGYFLGDSGSAVYTRELAREFIRQGHEVTLVCQEQNPGDYSFIDKVYDLDPGNSELRVTMQREKTLTGSCRLVRPHIGDRILTYVAGPFAPFEAVPFQDAPTEWILDYAASNVRAMTAIFERWPQDLVQANHAILQPWFVQEALNGKVPYVVTIHGSELNFTVRKDPRLVSYMAEGLEGAVAVAALSNTSREEVIATASAAGLDITAKTSILPPGVDTELFAPAPDASAALKQISPDIDPWFDDIAVFAGRLLWTKGLQYVTAALPLILKRRARLRLIIVGAGPMREPLEKFIAALGRGDIIAARNLTADEPELKDVPEYGPVIPVMQAGDEQAYQLSAAGSLGSSVHFTGHLPHDSLAPLFAAADVSLAPSVFPEAFGLVSIEALAAGAIPVATYQTGLRSPLDLVSSELGDPGIKALVPGKDFTLSLAATLTSTLERYSTRGMDFRRRLHDIAEDNFSWKMVASRYLDWAKR
jgi:glycosyltransferase involved in cell wall biosynthesis